MAKKVDDNGWWIIKDNPLSKVGIYPYLGKQIDDSLEPNKIYRVFRPAEELLNEETVKSFNLVPLVNDHEMIGKDFKPAEEKGIDGIIYNPRVAHGDMLIGNIKIYSEKMMDDIKNGKKELSMGYTCTYDLTPGDWDGQHYDVVQRNLKGNHVALVDRGRMGSDVRVYDKHICCDSMDVALDNIKRVKAQDITHETWELRKNIGLNYVTKRKEGTINRLIKEAGLPISRKTEATKLFGDPSYRNRFDAKFKNDKDWLNAQKVRFKQTRKKVGWKNMKEMPSFKRYVSRLAEIQEILDRRSDIERQVYGNRAGLDTAWIKMPKEEQEEPNIMEKAMSKSAEAAAIIALLSTVMNMNKTKKTAKDDSLPSYMPYLAKGVGYGMKGAYQAGKLVGEFEKPVTNLAKEFIQQYPNAPMGLALAAGGYGLYKLLKGGYGLYKNLTSKKTAKDERIKYMNIIKKTVALDKALATKLYKLGHAYGKALAKNCKTKTGMDAATALKTIDSKKRAALDAALNKKLYKLGVSYGKRLKAICGKKMAQDMATKVAVDMLSLNPRAAKDADENKWRYSKNIMGNSFGVGGALTGALADKLIKNKKPSYLKDALVEGGASAIRTLPMAALASALSPTGLPVAGITAGLGLQGAVNSLVRNKIQKSYPKLSSAQAQGVASGLLGAGAGGILGGIMGSGTNIGGLGGALAGALGGGIASGLGGLASRWVANKLYAPMPKSELGKKSK